MRRRISVLLVTLVGAAMLMQLPAWSSDSDKVLEFDTMVAVDGPFVGSANPIPSFQAIVSCLTGDESVATVNVSSGLFPANTAGDSRMEATVSLPSPCVAPIVFVASPTGAWFSATGQG